jgi:hypothetical protein
MNLSALEQTPQILPCRCQFQTWEIELKFVGEQIEQIYPAGVATREILLYRSDIFRNDI